MNNLTIVIPNRSRDLQIVSRSLTSIQEQWIDGMHIIVVDYGSEPAYQFELNSLIKGLSNIELILCPTQGQLWNKSRCINRVLKNCETSHIMVSDMDMIWHPQFIENHLKSFSKQESVYFTVGIMTQQEGALEKSFDDYQIKFQTDSEATGITVFPTAHLKSINGFDEFYHGWGSEDTDVHVRLRNAGYKVRFRESEVLFKHQWHEKGYRGPQGSLPYHNQLERINHAYCDQAKQLQKVRANQSYEIGKIKTFSPEQHFLTINCTSKYKDCVALASQLADVSGTIQIVSHQQHQSPKSKIKKLLQLEKDHYLSFQQVQNFWVEFIIYNRCYSYRFKIDHDSQKLELWLMK